MKPLLMEEAIVAQSGNWKSEESGIALTGTLDEEEWQGEEAFRLSSAFRLLAKG